MTKKGLIIVIAILSVALVASITGMILVIVGSAQTVTSNVKVKFTASNVNVTLSSRYNVNGAWKTMTTTGDDTGATILKLGKIDSEEISSGTLNPLSELQFTSDHPVIVFEYKIENKTANSSLVAQLKDQPVAGDGVDKFVNVSVQYAVSDMVEDVYTDLQLESDYETLVVGGNSEKYLYIVVTVDNLYLDAKYEGTFEWMFERATGAGSSTGNAITLTPSTGTTEDPVGLISTLKDNGFAKEVVGDDGNTYYKSTKYAYIKLTEDLDLREYETTIFNNQQYIFESFDGTIDAQGHKIYMNTTTNGNSSTMFYYFNGELKNAILEFGEGTVGDINWSRENKSPTRFENVTTEGTITLPRTDGYSPLIRKSWGNIAFVDCTNNLDILGQASRGAAFLGNYVTDESIPVAANQPGELGTLGTPSYLTVEFTRCVNNGDLTFGYAGMLYGNHHRYPNRDNLIVDDCINNGTIIGRTDAQLFCGYYFVGHTTGKWAYSAPYQDAVMARNEITNNGTVQVIALSDNITLEAYSDNLQIRINNGLLNESNSSKLFSYSIDVRQSIRLDNTQGFVVMTFDIQSTTDKYVDTEIFKYEFISSDRYNELSTNNEIVSTQEVTNASIRFNEPIGDVEVHIVTTTSGAKYYYITFDNFQQLSHCFYDSTNTNIQQMYAREIYISGYDMDIASNDKLAIYEEIFSVSVLVGLVERS